MAYQVQHGLASRPDLWVFYEPWELKIGWTDQAKMVYQV